MKPHFLVTTFAALALSGLLVAAIPASATAANPGDIDASFNGGVPAVIDQNPSHDIQEYATAINPLNGDILAAGSIDYSTGVITAYQPDGTLDTSIGTAGQITLTADQAGVSGGNLFFTAIAVDSQGRILAAGYAFDSSHKNVLVLARFKADGALDTGFGPSGTGVITDALNTYAAGDGGLALMPDGHILVIGDAWDAAGTEDQLTVWRFNDDGSADNSFGTSGYVQVPEINTTTNLSPDCSAGALQPDGELLIGCLNKVLRLNADGSLDTAFGTSGFVTAGTANTEVTGLALASDGAFIISEADFTTTPETGALRRYLADGTVDSGFNGGNPFNLGSVPFTNHLPVAVQPDGKMLVSFNGAGFGLSNNSLVIARVVAEGTLDSSFGTNGVSTVDFSNIGGDSYTPSAGSLLLQGDGKVVTNGVADSSAGSKLASFITRLDNDAFTLTPASFAFMDQTGVDLSATITSNAITVSGLSSGASVPVSVSGGEYSINGGAWTSTPGFTKDTDEIAVRHTSSASNSTKTTTTLTVGGYAVPNNPTIVLGTPVSADFTSTTKAAPPPPAPPPSGGGGGGGFGLFALFALLALTLLPRWLHQRRKHTHPDQIREVSPMKPYSLVATFAALALGGLLFAAIPAPASATNPGDIDASFDGGVPLVTDDNPDLALYNLAAAVNPLNGDILSAGASTLSSGSALDAGSILAYKSDGTFDTSVDITGVIGLTADQAGFPGGTLILQSVAVDGQGRILAAGLVYDPGNFITYMVLARFKPDGSLDTSFGSANTGIVLSSLNGYAQAYGLALTADGHILVTGESSNAADTQQELTVWRFTADGQVDTGFNTNGYVQVTGVSDTSNLYNCYSALQPDGKLIAGCTQGAAQSWTLARLNADGSLDTNFAANGLWIGCSSCSLGSIALAPDGGLVVSYTDITSPYAGYVFRTNPNGSRDENFNGGSDLQLTDNNVGNEAIPLAVQPDGKILVSQNGALLSGSAQSLIILRLLPDGSLDSSFGNTALGPTVTVSVIDFSSIGGNSYTPHPAALLVQGDGRIVAAGYAESSAGNQETAFVTRVLSDSYNLVPAAPGFTDVTRAPLGEAVTSNAATVSGVSIGGISNGVHVALVTLDGKYSTSGTGGPFAGSFTARNTGWAAAGDSLALEQMTPTSGGTQTTTTVAVGGFWAPNNYEILLGGAEVASWKTTTDQPPVANNGTLTATSGVATDGTLSATNPSKGTLNFTVVTQPGHGTLKLTDAGTGAYTYTSASGYTGSDSFTFKANDGVADSNTAKVSITVKAANQPPVAKDGTLTTDQNKAGSGTLSASDPDGDALTFSIVAQPAHGTVKINDASKGSYTYTPASGYSGSDSFTFKANDGQADSNTATVKVTVTATAPPPAPPSSGGGGGGGDFGLFALLGLLGLALTRFKTKIHSP